MNDARFSMRLPQSTLAFAQHYAAQCDMSLTQLILRYFARLQVETATAQHTPSATRAVRNIDSFIGIVNGASPLSDETQNDLRFKYLTEKYA